MSDCGDPIGSSGNCGNGKLCKLDTPQREIAIVVQSMNKNHGVYMESQIEKKNVVVFAIWIGIYYIQLGQEISRRIKCRTQIKGAELLQMSSYMCSI